LQTSALNNLNSTYEDYKMSTEAVIARHEAEYAAVQECLQLAQEELMQLKGRQDELQKILNAERAAWVSDKRTLEDTIVDLSTSERVLLRGRYPSIRRACQG
jgi:nucleoprotein TPR